MCLLLSVALVLLLQLPHSRPTLEMSSKGHPQRGGGSARLTG